MTDGSSEFYQYNRSAAQAVNDEFKLTEYQFEILSLIEKIQKNAKYVFAKPTVLNGGTITFDGANNILVSEFAVVDSEGRLIINSDSDTEIDTWLSTSEGVANYVTVTFQNIDIETYKRAAEHTSIEWYPVIAEAANIALSLTEPGDDELCLGYVTMESGSPVYYSTARSDTYISWTEFSDLFFTEHTSSGRHSSDTMQVIQTLSANIEGFQEKLNKSEAADIEYGVLQKLYSNAFGVIISNDMIGDVFIDDELQSNTRETTARPLPKEFITTQYAEAQNSFYYPAAMSSGRRTAEGSALARTEVSVDLEDASYDSANSCLWGYSGNLIHKLKIVKHRLVVVGTWTHESVTPSGVASDGDSLYILDASGTDTIYIVTLNSNGMPVNSSSKQVPSGGILVADSSQTLNGRTLPNKLRVDNAGNVWCGESTTGIYQYASTDFSASTGDVQFSDLIYNGAQSWQFDESGEDIYIVPVGEGVIIKCDSSGDFSSQITGAEITPSQVKSVIQIGERIHVLYTSGSTSHFMTLHLADTWHSGYYVKSKVAPHRSDYRSIVRALEGSTKYYMIGDTEITGASAAVPVYVSDTSLDTLSKTVNITGLDAEEGDIVSACIQYDSTYSRLLLVKQYNSLADSRIYYVNLGAIESASDGGNIAATTLVTKSSTVIKTVSWLDVTEQIVCLTDAGALITFENDGTNEDTVTSDMPSDIDWIVPMADSYKLLMVASDSRVARVLDMGRLTSSVYAESGLYDLGSVPLTEPFLYSASENSFMLSSNDKSIVDQVAYDTDAVFLREESVIRPLPDNQISGIKRFNRSADASEFSNTAFVLPYEFVCVWGPSHLTLYSGVDRSSQDMYEFLMFRYDTADSLFGSFASGSNDIIDVDFCDDVMFVGLADGSIRVIDFKLDTAYKITSAGFFTYNSGIKDRNIAGGYTENTLITDFTSEADDVVKLSCAKRSADSDEYHVCFVVTYNSNRAYLYDWSALTKSELEYGDFYPDTAPLDVRCAALCEGNIMVVAGSNLLLLDDSYPVSQKQTYMKNLAVDLLQEDDVVKSFKATCYTDEKGFPSAIVVGVLERDGNDVLFICSTSEESYEEVWNPGSGYSIVDYSFDHDCIYVSYEESSTRYFAACHRADHESGWTEPVMWDTIAALDDVNAISFELNTLYLGYDTQGVHVIPKPLLDSSEWFSKMINWGYHIESVVSSFHWNSDDGLVSSFINSDDSSLTFTNGASQNWSQTEGSSNGATDSDAGAPNQSEIVYDGTTEGSVLVPSGIVCSEVAVRVLKSASNAPVIEVSTTDSILGAQSVTIDIDSSGSGDDRFAVIPCFSGLTEEERDITIKISSSDSGTGDTLVFDGVLVTSKIDAVAPGLLVSKTDYNDLETWFTLSNGERTDLTVTQYFTTESSTDEYTLSAANASFNIKECLFGTIGNESALVELSDWTHDTPENGLIVVTGLGTFTIETGVSRLVVVAYKMGKDLTQKVLLTQPTVSGLIDNFATQRMLDFICKFQKDQS